MTARKPGRAAEAAASTAASAMSPPLQRDLFEDTLPSAPPPRIVIEAAPVLVGCAGWNVPAQVGAWFGAGDSEKTGGAGRSHLERYAALLPAVEINSSFYRPHQPATYARWRDTVPPGFRFSVKVPRALTHEARLRDTDGNLDRFLGEVGCLEDKLGCLLVQLPPSLAFDAFSAELFFDQLRMRTETPVACEPRHASWFGEAAAEMLARLEIAFVIADPPPVNRPVPAGYDRLVYYRLHGSPVIYRSAYPESVLDGLSAELTRHRRAGRQVWCVFDNTAEGHAMPNALALLQRAEKEIGWPAERRRAMRRLRRE
ncbi:MAG: DUF72 domain-containing protein [Burkholderiaceae bacterium]